jgi:hypothetical protein
MSVSYAGPLPSELPGRDAQNVANRQLINHRGITDCLFCNESFFNTASVLRHVKKVHRQDEIANSIDGWEAVDEDRGLYGMISQRKGAKFRLGYCWECHHWIPGTTLIKLMEHECKVRKPYVRKAAAAAMPLPLPQPLPLTPPAPASEDSDDDSEAESEDKDEKEWDDTREILETTLRKHTSKWALEDRTRIMAIVHKAIAESDAMMGCMDLVRALADLSRQPCLPAVPVAAAAAVVVPAVPLAVAAPVAVPIKKRLTSVGFGLDAV